MANQSNQLRLPAVGAKFPDLVPRIGGIKQAESANWVNFLLFIRFALARRNPTGHGRMNYKDTEPLTSAFFKIDLLTDFAALCLTDSIDWRYIHSLMVGILDPAYKIRPEAAVHIYRYFPQCCAFPPKPLCF
jgi:hypothetical protein